MKRKKHHWNKASRCLFLNSRAPLMQDLPSSFSAVQGHKQWPMQLTMAECCCTQDETVSAGENLQWNKWRSSRLIDGAVTLNRHWTASGVWFVMKTALLSPWGGPFHSSVMKSWVSLKADQRTRNDWKAIFRDTGRSKESGKRFPCVCIRCGWSPCDFTTSQHSVVTQSLPVSRLGRAASNRKQQPAPLLSWILGHHSKLIQDWG